MERQEILEKLKELLRSQQFFIKEEQMDEFSEDTSLLYDLVLDSIQILELLVMLEEKFEIICEANDLNIDLFDKVHTLIDFIMKKKYL